MFKSHSFWVSSILPCIDLKLAKLWFVNGFATCEIFSQYKFHEMVKFLLGDEVWASRTYPAGIYRSKLTIETLEQGVKYVQS